MHKRQHHIILPFTLLIVTVSSAAEATNEPLPIKEPKRGILSRLFCCSQTPKKDIKPSYTVKDTKPSYIVTVVKQRNEQPLSPASATQTPITKRYPHREHIRALVVDDDFSARKIIERYCKTVGIMNVDSVETGEEAIERAAKTSYNIFFMDTNLGTGIDGIKATAEIVKSSASKPIIISISSKVQSLAELAKNNMDGSLPKPFNKKDFQTLIERHFKPKDRTFSL